MHLRQNIKTGPSSYTHWIWDLVLYCDGFMGLKHELPNYCLYCKWIIYFFLTKESSPFQIWAKYLLAFPSDFMQRSLRYLVLCFGITWTDLSFSPVSSPHLQWWLIQWCTQRGEWRVRTHHSTRLVEKR